MKKYTLFLFVLSFILLGFNGFNANQASATGPYNESNYDSGCTFAGPYSTTTGKLCSTTPVVECAQSDLFSSVTGRPCKKVQDNSSFDRELKIGSGGDDVKILQQILKDQGYYLGKIDGKYGKRTARAVKDFQDDNDLTVTGNVDAETIGKITIVTPVIVPVNPPIKGGDAITIPARAPVISGISGPQILSVGQQGTWRVAASDRNDGNLSYLVSSF